MPLILSYIMILMISFFSFPLCSYAVDFYEFNEYMGVCPYSKTLTRISKNGSYAAYVSNPDKFARICPEIQIGSHVVLQNLDDIHWIVQIKEKEIQFRFQDVGYSPARGSTFVLTKLCGDCPVDNSFINTLRPGSGANVENVIFDFNKHEIKPSYFSVIDKIAQQMKTNQQTEIEIHGHTCSIGSEAHNKNLAENRADAVKKYLIKKGIPANQIKTKSFGYAIPVASNGTEHGRSQNRRVEFVLK